ncbi:MAG: hypothetical protein WAT74_18050, partial [Flavobacteriales bacterium]
AVGRMSSQQERRVMSPLDPMKTTAPNTLTLSESCPVQPDHLTFKLSMPSAVRDSADQVVSYMRHAIYLDEEGKRKLIELVNEPKLNPILFELLNDSNPVVAWNANLLLYYSNSVDGTALEQYQPAGCTDWMSQGRPLDISFWKARIHAEQH